MNGVICWMGPVSTSSLKSVNLPPGWEIVTIAQEVVAPAQTGGVALTPSMFAAYAATLGTDKLSTILKRASNSNPDQVILASFSAGHGLLDPLLLSSANDPRIIACYSADSYYGLGLKTGYVAFAKVAIANAKWFWLSTSNTKGGVTVHSGAESVAPFADAVGLVATNAFPAGMPQPVSARGNGNVWWLDYQAAYSHVQHATVLCPLALNNWFDQLGGVPVPPSPPTPGGQDLPPPPPGLLVTEPSSSPASNAVALGGAILGGYFVTKWIAGKFGK